MKFAGGCHCGAIRYELDGPPNDVALCHCTDCRKNSGAPVMSWAGYDADKMTFTKGEPKVFQMSPVSSRNFCGVCGAGLTYQNSEMLPGKVEVQSCTLDDPEAMKPLMHIQVAERLSWMHPGAALPECERFPD
jgi:hypothetical protein